MIKKSIDKVKGSLIGGAVGDTLGYNVEFMSYNRILMKYGKIGITRYELYDGVAEFSDDTQMTLYTACGLLNAVKNDCDIVSSISRAYVEWLYTQGDLTYRPYNECKITDIKRLHARRAPGITCITALTHIANGQKPINNSKGCGGIMRISPIPLYGVLHGWDIEKCDKLAADASKLTHQHPLGYMPSALLSHIIFRVIENECTDRNTLVDYIDEGLDVLCSMYAKHNNTLSELSRIVNMAINLANSSVNDIDAIRKIGEGWVAEETLAIAIYCTLKHFDSFEDAIVASVNHSGDSDSTGAVTGNIMGALLGFSAIPDHYRKDLELIETLEDIAERISSNN